MERSARSSPVRRAVVSVFDSGFVLGDGVWEGLRLVDGGVPFLHAHVERLYEGAKAIFMDVGISPQELVKRLFACIDANRMRDGVHIRLMVTRGPKRTPFQGRSARATSSAGASSSCRRRVQGVRESSAMRAGWSR